MESINYTERLWTPQFFVAIDADRCTLNTEYFHEVILRIFAKTSGIDPGIVESRREPIEAAGLTFHTDIEMRHVLAMGRGDAAAEEMMQEIFEQTLLHFTDPDQRQKLFMPGAEEFLGQLQESGVFARREAGFLTWGSEPLQRLKLACAGLSNLPVIYTQDRAKGVTLNDAYNVGRGVYELTLDDGDKVSAPYVILVDDKAPSFDGYPASNAHGFWMQFTRKKDLLPSQRGSVPANVEVCRSFADLRLHQRVGLVAMRNNT